MNSELKITHILVVEDSLTQAEELKYLLEKNGYKVTASVNGKNALEVMENNNFDLLISDIIMPEMDGFTLCSSIKKHSSFKHIPFILLTSLSDPIDIMKGLECGADSFVIKPYEEIILLDKINKLLNDKDILQREKEDIIDIEYKNAKYSIQANKKQVIELLISTFENAVQQNKKLTKSDFELRMLNERLEEKVFERTKVLMNEISEKKKAETELRQIKDELEKKVQERTSELVNANELLKLEISERKKIEEELVNANEELQLFAYIASHDLQEPLRMVTNYTKLLEKRYKEVLDQDGIDFIHFAIDGAKRMGVLINELRKYSQIGTKGKDFEKVNLNDTLKSILLNLRLLIEENEVEINCENLPIVYCDHVQIEQLFNNLISNAIKYKKNNEKSIVNIKSEDKDNHYLFSIQDNGIGISPKYFNRIFVIFQRLHTREEFKGTGMGLAICKKIVERHNGKIWVESEENIGSTFYFTIPKV